MKDGGESGSNQSNYSQHNQYNPYHHQTDLPRGKDDNGNSKAGDEVEGKGKGEGKGEGEGESEEDVYKRAMRPLQYDETSELSKYHYK